MVVSSIIVVLCLCPQGCSESLWLGEMLCRLAEILRLQDPGSVQLEMVSVANTFPDLRYRERNRKKERKKATETATVFCFQDYFVGIFCIL